MANNPFGKIPGGLAGMGNMIKAMETAMKSAQKTEEELAQMRIETSSGGGMVKVIVTGKGDLVEIKIAPEVVNPSDVQMLEDLVSTAVREAIEKANTLRTERLQELMPAGANIPGIF